MLMRMTMPHMGRIELSDWTMPFPLDLFRKEFPIVPLISPVIFRLHSAVVIIPKTERFFGTLKHEYYEYFVL